MLAFLGFLPFLSFFGFCFIDRLFYLIGFFIDRLFYLIGFFIDKVNLLEELKAKRLFIKIAKNFVQKGGVAQQQNRKKQ